MRVGASIILRALCRPIVSFTVILRVFFVFVGLTTVIFLRPVVSVAIFGIVLSGLIVGLVALISFGLVSYH